MNKDGMNEVFKREAACKNFIGGNLEVLCVGKMHLKSCISGIIEMKVSQIFWKAIQG